MVQQGRTERLEVSPIVHHNEVRLVVCNRDMSAHMDSEPSQAEVAAESFAQNQHYGGNKGPREEDNTCVRPFAAGGDQALGNQPR